MAVEFAPTTSPTWPDQGRPWSRTLLAELFLAPEHLAIDGTGGNSVVKG